MDAGEPFEGFTWFEPKRLLLYGVTQLPESKDDSPPVETLPFFSEMADLALSRITDYLDCSSRLALIGSLTDQCENAEDALMNDHVSCLERLAPVYRSDVPWGKYLCQTETLWDPRHAMIASLYNSLSCLRWMHKTGCNWDTDATAAAAANGNMRCLTYLIRKGCPIDTRAVARAAMGGHSDCFEFAIENLDPCIKFESDTLVCRKIAECGRLDYLKRAREKGFAWDVRTTSAAAGRCVECLRYAYENGCPRDATVIVNAAWHNRLDCLKYLISVGCYSSTVTRNDPCGAAASTGHLECLKYLHQSGVHWDERTCSYASTNGHFDCLRYAHENGCPWNKFTVSGAATSGCIHCLRYSIENGCEFDPERVIKDACYKGNLESIKYLHEKGCKLPVDAHISVTGLPDKDCLDYMNSCDCVDCRSRQMESVD
jgi:hypothetical protein